MVLPRGQAVAHFSFAVGVCSFRFFMERKRARERVRRRLRAERGRHFRQIYSRAGGLSNSRGQRGGAAEGRETETHVTDLFHFRKHLSTQRICLKISNWAPSMPSHCSVRSSSVWGLFLKLTYRYSARRGEEGVQWGVADALLLLLLQWGWPPKNKLMMCPFDT